MNSNSRYILGDFYIARTKASGGAGFYPYFGNSTNLWKHAWTSCQTPQLETSALNSAVTIYANGQHCAAVHLYFDPADDNDNKIPFPEGYFAEVLQKYGTAFPFKLIQYLGNDLPDGWSSLTAPTPFTANVPGREAQAAALQPDPPSGSSALTLYVTSSKQTDIQLGIQVTTADGTTHTFDSTGGVIEPVTVTTLSSITYTSSLCTIDITGDTQPSGDRQPRLKNFYLHPSDSENFKFIQSKKISGGLTRDLSPTWTVHWPDNEMIQWIYWYDDLPAIVGSVYYWNIDLGQVTKDTLGMADTPRDNVLSPQFFSTTINDQAGALNVTLALQTWQEYTDGNGTQKSVADSHCKFEVYDQYGNSGLFTISVADYSDPNPTLTFPDG